MIVKRAVEYGEGGYLTTGGQLYHGNHSCSCNKCVSSVFTATLRTENIPSTVP